tara:strand:+ start:139 stop:705 length:567 start_codon:yes stop_codon:yes gene_type:complete
LNIFLATNNEHKRIEIESIFLSISSDFKLFYDDKFVDVEETEDTLEGNASLKAIRGYEHMGMPALADDTGLFVKSLNDNPGVKSKRYYSENSTDLENIDFLLANLKGSPDRSAYFKTVVCFFDGKDSIYEEGVLDGEIASSSLGNNGFGYDSVFLYDQRTLAQLNTDEKNDISHRKIALTKIAKNLVT